MPRETDRPEPTAAPEGGRAPRTYRITRVNRIGAYAVAALAVGIAAALALVAISAHLPAAAAWSSGVAAVSAFALAAYLVADARASRLVLTDDAIALHGLGRPQVMRREDAAGWRLLLVNGDHVIVIVPRQPGRKPLRFAVLMDIDPQLLAWLSTIPDLDREDCTDLEKELLAERGPGESRESLRRSLRHAHRVARFLGLLTLGPLALPFLARPPPLLMALSMALPLVALILLARSRGLFTAARAGARASLAGPLLIPCCALPLRAMTDVHPLARFPGALHAGSIAIGLVLTLAVYALDRTLRHRVLLLLGFAFVLRGYGHAALLYADARLDRAPAQVYPVRVLAKLPAVGPGLAAVLKVAPWGPRTRGNAVLVPSREHDAADVGGTVHVLLHPGALGLPWYEVRTAAP